MAESRDMSEKTKFGYFAKKIIEQMCPPTVPDNHGKNIMSRREASLIVVLISSLSGGGTYYLSSAEQARAQGINDQKVVTLEKELEKKADEKLIDQKFITVQNQLNNIESGVNDNKDSIEVIEGELQTQTQAIGEINTNIGILLDRIPVR